MVKQGDIVTVRGIKHPMLVVSKDSYNKTGNMLVCPIVKEEPDILLKVYFETPQILGYVCCDSIRQLCWEDRGCSNKGSIPIAKLLYVLDMISSIFDFI
jgi:mRNA-degrading endonuclease toxin of MazEF toxin-antitoxin module